MGREGKGREKRTHEHGQQCSDCRERGWVKMEDGIGKINANEKNSVK